MMLNFQYIMMTLRILLQVEGLGLQDCHLGVVGPSPSGEGEKMGEAICKSSPRGVVCINTIFLALLLIYDSSPILLALQVSKAAPTGEFLPTGSFMIRGRKNYLPPQVRGNVREAAVGLQGMGDYHLP